MFVHGRLGQTQGYVKMSKFADPMQPAVEVGSETSHFAYLLVYLWFDTVDG